jgi:hypothetical protein
VRKAEIDAPLVLNTLNHDYCLAIKLGALARFFLLSSEVLRNKYSPSTVAPSRLIGNGACHLLASFVGEYELN